MNLWLFDVSLDQSKICYNQHTKNNKIKIDGYLFEGVNNPTLKQCH